MRANTFLPHCVDPLFVQATKKDAAFVARGLASRDKAVATGHYVAANAVLDRLAAARDRAKGNIKKPVCGN